MAKESRTGPTTLVGRVEELHRIVQAIRTPPAVVVIEGEPGVGKSRLVTELARHRDLDDRPALIGHCHRMQEPFPLGPFVEALRAPEVAATIRNVSPIAGALAPLLPELNGVLPPLLASPGDPATEWHQRCRALVEVLSALGPAMLVLEDLQWADTHTVDFLSYLARGDWPPGLALVLTLGDDEKSPELVAAIADLTGAIAHLRLSLEPLDYVGTREMAGVILGADMVTRELATQLSRRTAGLPLAIEEQVALLRDRGDLATGTRAGGGAPGDVAGVAGRWERVAEAVPVREREQMRQRMRVLPPSAAAMVAAAATLRTPQRPELVVAVSGIRGGRAAQGLVAALEAGVLVEQDDGRVGFRHLLAADAAYTHLPGTRRRELHARAARRLRSTHPVPLRDVAYHLRQAGARRNWPEVAEHAADEAVRLDDDVAAAELLEDVLRHADLATEDRRRLAIKLGRCAADARWYGRVDDLLTGVADPDLPAEERGELELLLSLSLTDQTAGQRLRAEVAENAAVSPALRAWAMALLSFPAQAGVSEAERARWRGRAHTLLPRISDPAMASFVSGKLAMAALPVGDHRWREHAAAVRDQIGDAPHGQREAKACYAIGFGACYAGHHQVARQWLDRAIGSLPPRVPLRWEVGSARALLDFCTGAWDELEPELDQLRFQLADRPSARVDAETAAGGLLLARGDPAAAQRLLAEVIETATETGCGDLLPVTTGLMVRAALASGDSATAIAEVGRLRELIEQHGAWAPAVRALPPAAEALARAGHHREASAWVEWFVAALSDRDAPLALAGVDHARGLLLAADGNPVRAAASLERAASAYRTLACPYEAAQAREQAAQALLAAAETGASDGPYATRVLGLLSRAHSAYSALGASRDQDRAAGLARRHQVRLPGRRRSGRRSYGDALSPREREVAELAAQGYANSEIASKLFVSVKTVEGHLSAVLRKLGIRTRTAIIHQLASTPSPGGRVYEGEA